MPSFAKRIQVYRGYKVLCVNPQDFLQPQKKRGLGQSPTIIKKY